MNEFENKLIIKDDPYQNGFFPQIPNSRKRGSAFILTGGCNDDIVVDEYTTSKKIRQGKYTRLVEISILPYTKEISFNSVSKEPAYSFDVYVKAVIQVKDPITFYHNKNIDVDSYFHNLFSLDVRKITRCYSILHYDNIDSDLTQKLSSYNTYDTSTGFSYQISVVSAVPGKNAMDYVYKHSTQQLDIELKENARNLVGKLTKDYSEAIMTEVIEGKLSEREAIIIIQQYQNANFNDQVNRLEALRGKGFLTDLEAKSFIAPAMECLGNRSKQIDEQSDQNNSKTTEASVLDEFYIGE